MKARQAPPASHATHTLPVRDTSVDEWKSSLVESAKRTDRIEALLRQYLAQQAEARPEPKPEVIPQVMPEAITPELEPEVIPRVMPELEAEARPEAKPEAIAPEQMAEARPQPETTASNHLPLLDATTDTSTARPGTARNAPENPYRVAWNKIKRTVANLTDGDIMIFMAQPELAVLYMGMLASMVPTESPW